MLSYCYSRLVLPTSLYMTSKAVFITGGAVRIGRAIAVRLAKQGHPIAIHYRHSGDEARALTEELNAMGVPAAAVCADFFKPFDADALLKQAHDSVGPIHHLVNNASSFDKDTLETITHETFTHHMHVNLYAPLSLIQAFTSYQRTRKLSAASITNIGDGAKGWSLSSKHLSYALSKYGLMQLANMLAIELAPNIRINNVAPGPSLPGHLDEEDTFKRLAKRIPLGHVSSEHDICDAVEYLLKATSVTGQTIWLGGGLHCHQAIDIQAE